MNIFELQNITKIYGTGDSATTALKNVNLEIEQDSFYSIMGPSGSGKSTLLNILGCMDLPTSGNFLVHNENMAHANNKKLSSLRGSTVSFIFQNFALLPDYTAYENICLPLNCRKISGKEKRERIYDYMKKLKIDHLAKKKPTQLSGGQQQRVAIARALVTENEVILADEPTGALDQKTGLELLELLTAINEEGKCIIIVTHDEKVAAFAKKKIYIEDGVVELANR